MSSNAGVWIDHRQAIIVITSASGEALKQLDSQADKHHATHEDAAEDKRERRFANQLHTFYAEVIDSLKGVSSVLVIGPGEAKKELRKQMATDHRMDKCKVEIESADKMTEHQVTAKVKHHFK